MQVGGEGKRFLVVNRHLHCSAFFQHPPEAEPGWIKQAYTGTAVLRGGLKKGSLTTVAVTV